jgi:hypothetical protein
MFALIDISQDGLQEACAFIASARSRRKRAMPKRLLERCQPDSILEFRASAGRRYDDGLALAAAGHRTGAIYLWGYAAEMTLKAAYFALAGLVETDVITWSAHTNPAIARGKSLGVAWPSQGAGHNVRAWAELLVKIRATMPGLAYPITFGLDVQSRGQRISELWRETLRYHKNVAYKHELDRIREAVRWLLANAESL